MESGDSISDNGAGRNRGHAFSIELKSMQFVERIAMPCETGVGVLIEGFLGRLEGLNLVEGVMLEVRGENGIVRIEMREEELRRLITKGVGTH